MNTMIRSFTSALVAVMTLGLVQTAQAEATITGVTARQRYPWNGLVDIDYALSGELSTNYTLKVWAVNTATGEKSVATTITAEATPFAPGTHKLVWDMNADGFTNVAQSVVFTVTAEPVREGVQLWADGPYFATTNIGAENPEDYGYYFWWGDTVGYTNTVGKAGGKGTWYSVADGKSIIQFLHNYSPADSTYGKSIATLQGKGWIDATTNLVPAHDAATAHWGSPWRMMTNAELAALLSKTETVWTKNWNGTGVAGRIVKGKGTYADKSIFMPAAGYGMGTTLNNSSYDGNYWSSTPNSSETGAALGLAFSDSLFVRQSRYTRSQGLPVRPVRATAAISGASDPVALDLRTGTVRDAAVTETLTYSTDYAEGATTGASVDITVNGETLASGLTGSGTVTWTPIVPGTNELHHIVKSGTAEITNLVARFIVQTVAVTPQAVKHATAKVYTNGVEVAGPPFEVLSNATVKVVYTADDGYAFQPGGSRTFDTGDFTADKNPTTVPESQLPATPAAVTLTGVTAQQRYPWNGLVDIGYTLSGELSTNDTLMVWAVDTATHVTNVARTVTFASDALTAGTHNLVWDMNADGFTNVAQSVVFTVAAEKALDGVRLWKDGPYFATTNIGAENPEDYGYYFWWGDTVGYVHGEDKYGQGVWMSADGKGNSISFENHYPANSTLEKDRQTLQDEGWIDKKLYPSLTMGHDAARAHWGSPWRMPTADDLYDLTVYCTRTWVNNWKGTGINGYVVTGKNAGYTDKSIFLPAAGFGYERALRKSESGKYEIGCYLSSSPNAPRFEKGSFAYSLEFSSYGNFAIEDITRYRSDGCTIRPVSDTNTGFISGDSDPVALDLRTGTVRDAVQGAIETLTFTTNYPGGAVADATVDITVDGETLVTTNGSGTVTWTPSKLGTNELHHIVKSGTAEITNLVARFVVSEPPVINDCITFSSAAAFSLKAENASKHWDGTLWTSTDKKHWTEWNGGEVQAAGTGGAYNLYVRGNADNTVIAGAEGPWHLTGGAGIACTGNVETLRGATGDDPSPAQMGLYCYGNLFLNCTLLTEAPALPATKLAPNCYYSMFCGTSLTNAPALPATNLVPYCYACLFTACRSLTNAPALPATTLAKECYDSMFAECTSLKEAPALPATTLAYGCYNGLFRDCTALTEAPDLPATNLAANCYSLMFSNCKALTRIPALPATNLAEACYYEMFTGCKGITLYGDGTGDTWSIPSGATASEDWGTDMFEGTGGTLQGQPEIGKTYYYAPLPLVEVKPDAETGTKVSGAYTNGVEVAKTEAETYRVISNATVDVVFKADTAKGYFYKNGAVYSSFATNTVTASSDPTVVKGPAAVQGTRCGGEGVMVYGFLEDGKMTLVGSGATGSGSASNPFDKASITNVVIEAGVTEVGQDFFKSCTWLESVTGGKDLTAVGKQAFYDCPSLKTITLDCTAVPTGMTDGVVYRTSLKPDGKTFQTPKISVKGHVEMLYGKKSLNDADWTSLGPAEGQSIYDQGDYRFFQIRLMPE